MELRGKMRTSHETRRDECWVEIGRRSTNYMGHGIVYKEREKGQGGDKEGRERGEGMEKKESVDKASSVNLSLLSMTSHILLRMQQNIMGGVFGGESTSSSVSHSKCLANSRSPFTNALPPRPFLK